MDNIPLEEQLVIDELVELWQTPSNEPRDLVAHINGLSGPWGSGLGARFVWQVYENLRTGKRNRYSISTASEFKRFLEAKYSQHTQAPAKPSECKEDEWRAKADFDDLGREMAKAPTRAELIELGRKREKLAPYTGSKHYYENVCWCCHSDISSTIHARCPDCRWYICSNCGSCSRDCNNTYKSVVHGEAVDEFVPDPGFPDDIS